MRWWRLRPGVRRAPAMDQHDEGLRMRAWVHGDSGTFNLGTRWRRATGGTQHQEAVALPRHGSTFHRLRASHPALPEFPLAALSHHPVAIPLGCAHTSPVAAPTVEPASRVCANCGESSLVGVRCTAQPPTDCDDVGRPHIHWGCSNCPSHWVEPTSGRCCARRR